MTVKFGILYWGDTRSVAQHQAYEAIEQARWRWRVARNEARRAAAAAQPKGWLPAFLRRQAL